MDVYSTVTVYKTVAWLSEYAEIDLDVLKIFVTVFAFIFLLFSTTIAHPTSLNSYRG